MKTILVAFLTMVILPLTALATPRPGAGRGKAVSVKTSADAQSLINSSGLNVEGLSGESLKKLIDSKKISVETAGKLLSSDVKPEHKALCGAILQATLSSQKGQSMLKFSSSKKESGDSTVAEALSKMTQLTVNILNGRSGDINPLKLEQVAQAIDGFNKGSKTTIEYEATKNQVKEILNAGLSEDTAVVKQEEDPFDVIRKCD